MSSLLFFIKCSRTVNIPYRLVDALSGKISKQEETKKILHVDDLAAVADNKEEI